MGDKSQIEWTDATWNPVTGCSVVSPGCTNCYAMRMAGKGRLKNHPSRTGLTQDTKAGPVWNGEVRLNEQWLSQPLRWRKPRMIFVCAHGDLFHENVPDEWIDKVFAVMALAPQHTFQVLTKRAERMRRYVGNDHEDTDLFERIADVGARLVENGDAAHSFLLDIDWPLPNVWLGVSCEDQRRADERIPDLLATPAAIRFVSAEQLLGPIDLTWLDTGEQDGTRLIFDGLTGLATAAGEVIPGVLGNPDPRLHWVICGGESDTGARPMHPDWARSLRDQCAAADTPFFFKQWGSWAAADVDEGIYYSASTGEIGLPAKMGQPTHRTDGAFFARVGKQAAGAVLDGREHKAWPEVGRC